MSKKGLNDIRTTELEQTTTVLATDLVPVFTDQNTVPKLAKVSEISSDTLLTTDNEFTGDNDFTGELNAGKSGSAGDFNIFPATASKGNLKISIDDQTGNTEVEVNVNAMGQATVVNIDDPGAAASHLVQSTAQITLAEADVLDGATAGTQVASKAVIADANVNTGISKVTELHIGATGAETQVTATAAELNYNDITAAGSAEASKSLVLDGSRNISGIATLGATNIDAGASGTAGSVDVFPTTASKGKFTLACTDQTGDTAVTLNANAMGQATSVNIADPGAATSYVVQSTAAITLVEADVLDGATAGTQVASKAVVADANINIGIVKATELHIGATGAETQVTATGAELNYCDVTAAGTAEASKALVVDGSKDIASINILSATTLNGTTVNAGASGTAGSLYVFPTTASKGKFGLACTDQTGDTTVAINANAMGQATTVNIADPGVATSYVAQSTAALTLAEVDVLDGATAGTQVASKVIVTDANINQGIAKVTELHIGATGAETQVTATGAELNYNDITAAGTAEASKALITDGSIGITGITTLGATNIDAGASGTAGNIDIFPTTASKGKTTLASADNTGDTTTAITVAAQAAARAYTIPDAGGDASFVFNTDRTDFVKFLGLGDVLAFSAGTWTTTRVAQGDYVSRKTAAADTTIIGIDITEILRTTASKGLKLTSFDVIFRNTTADLNAHTVTLDQMTYTDSAAVVTTNVALTGALGVGQDADPQIDNITIDTPAFNVTDDSKYVMELTVNAAAGSIYDFIGVMLKFTRNDM